TGTLPRARVDAVVPPQQRPGARRCAALRAVAFVRSFGAPPDGILVRRQTSVYKYGARSGRRSPPGAGSPLLLSMGAMSRDRFCPAAWSRGVRSILSPLLLALLLGAHPVSAQSLRGSPVSLDLQNRMAREHDYTYIETPQRVQYFVEQGWLVRVRPTEDFTLHAVSFPYARPEVA